MVGRLGYGARVPTLCGYVCTQQQRELRIIFRENTKGTSSWSEASNQTKLCLRKSTEEPADTQLGQDVRGVTSEGLEREKYLNFTGNTLPNDTDDYLAATLKTNVNPVRQKTKLDERCSDLLLHIFTSCVTVWPEGVLREGHVGRVPIQKPRPAQSAD